METEAPTDPRDSAIAYAVRRIAGDPAVYWHFLGTESWSRLLEAHAAITGQSLTDLHLLMVPDEDAYREQCETEERRRCLDSGERPRCLACEARDEVGDIPESAMRDIIGHTPLWPAWETLPDYDRRRLRRDLAAA